MPRPPFWAYRPRINLLSYYFSHPPSIGFFCCRAARASAFHAAPQARVRLRGMRAQIRQSIPAFRSQTRRAYGRRYNTLASEQARRHPDSDEKVTAPASVHISSLVAGGSEGNRIFTYKTGPDDSDRNQSDRDREEVRPVTVASVLSGGMLRDRNRRFVPARASIHNSRRTGVQSRLRRRRARP